MTRWTVRSGWYGFLFLAPLLAAPARALELTKDDLKVGGYVDGGRFQLADNSVNGEILNRMGAKWLIEKQFDEHWTAMANLHWLFWRNQASDLALFHIAGLKFDSDLQGWIKYGNGAHRVKGGLYEFKYNPDSKDLGEYLLRSEAYPTIVENSQGKDLLAYSFSRVAGLEYGLDFEWFRQTGLIYAEQFNAPVNDINLVYIAAAGPESAELGFGVSLHRFFKMGNTINNAVLDPALREYVKSQGLETKAVKLMLRGRLDIAAMLGMNDNFKLYGEAALLGLKSDSLFYKHTMQRVPMMAGLEIPTFGILNVLSVETELLKNPYFGRKYLVSDGGAGNNFSALPYIDDYKEANLPNYSQDDWKWSVFAHKALNNWIDLKVRFASDHLRLMSWDGDYQGGRALTRRTQDWYFLARIEYHN